MQGLQGGCSHLGLIGLAKARMTAPRYSQLAGQPIYLSTYVFTHPPSHIPTVYPSTHSPTHLPTHPPTHQPIHSST